MTKRIVGRLNDVHAVLRGVAAGMSDHFLVEAREKNRNSLSGQVERDI